MVPVLHTARLTLRGFAEADLDAYAALLADPEVMRHLGVGPNAGQPRDRAESWAGMAGAMGQWALRGCGFWALEYRGICIGRAGILNPEGWPEPELAYALARDAWGQGLALEAATAALAWARGAMAGQEIVSFIRPENAPSQRLAARLGASHTGRIDLMGVSAERWAYPR